MNHADLLAQIPLFEGLTDEDRAALAERMDERTYKTGQPVFAMGEQGSSMYICEVTPPAGVKTQKRCLWPQALPVLTANSNA